MGRKCLAENKLLLYTNAGEPLATITWNESCLVGMGWVELGVGARERSFREGGPHLHAVADAREAKVEQQHGEHDAHAEHEDALRQDDLLGDLGVQVDARAHAAVGIALVVRHRGLEAAQATLVAES